jgi:cholesterol transport system auxiliary component
MTKKSKLYFSSLLLFTALIIGCGGINKSYPERTYFLFEVSSPSNPLTPVQGTTVEVKRFSISPGSEGKEFIYRTTDTQYLSDFYYQFFRPPSVILTEAVTQWLDQAQVFEDVLNPISQVFPGYFIEGNIVELYGDYRNQSAAKAVMKIQFYLLKTSDDADQPEIIFGKMYESIQPIGSATPQNLMNGWNLALEDILGEILKDLSYHLPRAQQ